METMQLTLNPDAMNAISEQLSKNEELARPIATQLLETVDKMTMANFLLSDGMAMSILVGKLTEAPQETLKSISKLSNGEVPKKRGRGRPKKAKSGPGSRPRLSEEELAKLEKKTFTFIKKHPECMRKDIQAKVDFPSAGTYKKVIDSLKEQKLIKQKGQKALTNYSAK